MYPTPCYLITGSGLHQMEWGRRGVAGDGMGVCRFYDPMEWARRRGDPLTYCIWTSVPCNVVARGAGRLRAAEEGTREAREHKE